MNKALARNERWLKSKIKEGYKVFEYDAENNLVRMKIDVDADGIKTSVVSEIIRMRSSKDFPDVLFEF